MKSYMSHYTWEYYREKRVKFWFTLIETLLVISIIAILFWVLFQSYAKTAELTLKIENEQTLMSEILFLNQYLDNLVDNYQIDFKRYIDDNIDIDISWQSEQLLLINRNNNEQIKVYPDWDCIAINPDQYTGSTSSIKCTLISESNTKTFEIIDSSKVYFANTLFTILPHRAYSSGSIYSQLEVDEINAEWFWINGNALIKNYNQNIWTLNANTAIQTFFNISK